MLKKLGVLAGFCLLSSGLWAQVPGVSGSAGGVNAPAPALDFAPSVESGARTDLKGNLVGGSNNNTVGPFVTPGLAINYAQPHLNVALTYTAEISSARGYGDASPDHQFSGNTYIEHDPKLVMSGGINPDWKLNMYLEDIYHTESGDQMKNKNRFRLSPDVERKVNEHVSLALGYYLERITDFDTTLQGQDLKSAVAKAATINTVGQEPTVTLHSAIAWARVKIIDGVGLNTYVRAGKDLGNAVGTTGYAYRLNSELNTITPIPNLTGQLRYRLGFKDVKGGSLNYYNHGRVIASYALNKAWSIDLQNTFQVDQSTAAAVKASYENENYLGATFKF